MQYSITFATLEFQIASPIYFLKILPSSKQFPRRSTNSTLLTVFEGTAVDRQFSLLQWPWLQQL